ncbi:MAG: DUF4091 domain-containing protein [Clostridia bacterium]|nr:DUF4091 domain-containing protein [Clostridia bacterium]
MSKTVHKLISSMEKCFGDCPVDGFSEFSAARAVRGERFSFQWVFRGADPIDAKEVCYFRAESALGDAVRAQRVEVVPVRMPYYELRHDDNYLRGEPGLYPDLLMPVSDGTQVYITSRETHALWIDVDIPADAPAGECPIRLTLVNEKGDEKISAAFTLTVVGALLPEQTLQHTEWFHADCLADYYQVPVWSEEHWRIVENFVAAAVRGGVNMLLTPIVTPALDTAVGGERTTVQLTEITCDGGVWSFDFTRLGRWIDMAERQGIRYFEMAHLYTQWGAGHAPKIMATVDGEYKKVFGWETDSLSEEYRTFLQTFLPALTRYLRERGIADRCVFHISDEPHVEHLERYGAARAQVTDCLRGFVIMDALSNYDFYRAGVVDRPIPSTGRIEPFLEGDVPGLWTYYCCSQNVKLSNRFVAMPGARMRILGVQLYKYRIAGFLQWGFNFYNSQYSVAHIDPYRVTDGEYFAPAGDAFQVYPAPDGTAYETQHYLLFAEALRDLRLMQLAEAKCGREAVMAAIEGNLETPITFTEYPKDAAYLTNLHETLCEMIAQAKAE